MRSNSKAQSRAFRAALTAFWKTCSAASPGQAEIINLPLFELVGLRLRLAQLR